MPNRRSRAPFDPPGSGDWIVFSFTELKGDRKPAKQNDPDPVEVKGVERSDSNGATNDDLHQTVRR
jgi:hypothetical protein